MTVISTIITRYFTAHASDSFITVRQPDGTYKVTESQETKLVKVPKFRGAMAYWGLATRPDGWNTLAWLRAWAERANSYDLPETFARDMGKALQDEVAQRTYNTPTGGGIGVHFTAYELVNGYQVPELFMISNWLNPSYDSLRPGGIGVSRETYATIVGLEDRPDSQREQTARLAVFQLLQDFEGLIRYNNGDPMLFNPIADSVIDVIGRLRERGAARVEAKEAHAALARRPVEIVSQLLSSFAREGTRLVGGKPHDLVISPSGEYWSSTGD